MEQEFFEAFNLPTTYKYKMVKKDMSGIACNKESIIMFVKAGLKVVEVIKDDITPEIVLGLITILVKKHCNLTLYWGLPKLTEQILKQCIKDSKDKEIQDQVRALFND